MKKTSQEPLLSPDMPRRVFMGAIAGGLLGARRPAEAQEAKRIYTVGLVSIGTGPGQFGLWQSFIDAMRERGYVEGRNLVVKRAFGNPDRLAGMLAELVAGRVDAIVTTGPRETRTAQRATATIPIVMTFVEDPVAEGFVKSLAQPGTNATGLTSLVPGLSQKYVELLNEALPAARRFGVVATRDPVPENRHELEAAVKARGLTVLFLVVSQPVDFDTTLARAKRDGVTGIIAPVDGVTFLHRRALVEAASKHRLPGIYWAREYAEAGGLLTYGAGLADLRRHAAIYVDKILRGARPADLPIEQPTKFDLVINLKTAKALGLTIPPSLLLRADQVSSKRCTPRCRWPHAGGTPWSSRSAAWSPCLCPLKPRRQASSRSWSTVKRCGSQCVSTSRLPATRPRLWSSTTARLAWARIPAFSLDRSTRRWWPVFSSSGDGRW